MGKAFDQLGPLVIVANTTNPNVLQGRLLDRAPFLAAGTVYATGSNAGLQMTLTSGMDTVCRAIDINAQNRVPVVPDDVLVTDFICQPGAQLGLAVTNTTAGNLNVFIKIELVELEAQYQG
jgi:hypothetical protein